jgi:hypothetical protein
MAALWPSRVSNPPTLPFVQLTHEIISDQEPPNKHQDKFLMAVTKAAPELFLQ